MSNNKKKKHPSQQSRSAMPSTPVTLRDKKKQMIRGRIHSDDLKRREMRAVGMLIAAILILRTALFIYELIYYSAVDEPINVISNILLLPLLVILLMARDGNKPLAGISAVSAIVRMFYLFLAVYPSLSECFGALAFIIIYMTVMAAQLILSLAVLYMPSVDAYCKEMQLINLELRSHIVTKR